MTDEDALHRAIIANPAEDSPRLAYADWLEENNRAEEAEFIRLDCRLYAEGPDDPEYADHVIRCVELRSWLTSHAPRPKVSLEKGISLHANEWWNHSARGFPRFLTINRRMISRGGKKMAAALESAFQKIPTRWIVFDSNIDAGTLADLLRQPVSATLDSITLSVEPGLGEEHVQAVVGAASRLTSLRGLYLSFQIVENAAAALGRCDDLAGLERFSVGVGNLTPAAFRSLAGGWFSRLRDLHLTDGLPADAFEELCRLPEFTRLHSLHLGDNAIPPAAWQVFARSKSFPALRVLDLRGGDMSNGQLGVVASHPDLRLAVLDATYCSVGDAGVRALVKAPWIESLQTLDLGYCSLGPDSAAAIGSCRKLSGLKCLELAGNRLGTAGLQSIAASRSLRGLACLHVGKQTNLKRPSKAIRQFLETLDMPALRDLDLHDLPLGPHAALLADERFRNLRRLSLSNCQLTDEVVQGLLMAPAFQQLIELRLENNELGTGVQPLADRNVMPQMSYCSLTTGAMGTELVRKLGRRRGLRIA